MNRSEEVIKKGRKYGTQLHKHEFLICKELLYIIQTARWMLSRGSDVGVGPTFSEVSK